MWVTLFIPRSLILMVSSLVESNHNNDKIDMHTYTTTSSFKQLLKLQMSGGVIMFYLFIHLKDLVTRERKDLGNVRMMALAKRDERRGSKSKSVTVWKLYNYCLQN